jgi:hypothetical protein
MTAKLLPLALLVVVLPGLALAEDPKAKAAREELERQLNQMVGEQPTRVRIDMIGLDDPNYRLEEASFELDGRSLRSPSMAELGEEGSHLVWEGDAAPGKHMVKVRLVFANGASVLLSDEGGYKWTLSNERSFELHSGIEVRVAVTPKRDSSQRDVAKRFGLTLPAMPVMIAQLDDGKMPEAAPKPVLAGPPDAGPSAEQLAALAAADKQSAGQAAAQLNKLAEEEKKAKAQAAAELKRAAAEEKKRKAAEAAEAKRLAADEKKQKAAEVAEARRAAAEEKKRAAAEAAEAKRLAGEEKRRLAAEAVDRQQHPEKYVVAPRAVAEVIDDGLPQMAEVDAGHSPVAVADAGGTAVATVPAPVEEAGNPMWIWVGAGAGGLLVLLILLARRRSRPPTLDD